MNPSFSDVLGILTTLLQITDESILLTCLHFCTLGHPKLNSIVDKIL